MAKSFLKHRLLFPNRKDTKEDDLDGFNVPSTLQTTQGVPTLTRASEIGAKVQTVKNVT